MPTWPPTLPLAPLVHGLREQRRDQVVRTPTDSGPSKARPRSLAAPVDFEFDLLLAWWQADRLADWYRDELQDGALPFRWLHPRTRNVCELRFRGPPTFTALGPRRTGQEKCRVSLSLELIPGTEVVVPDVPAPPPPPPPPPPPFVFTPAVAGTPAGQAGGTEAPEGFDVIAGGGVFAATPGGAVSGPILEEPGEESPLFLELVGVTEAGAGGDGTTSQDGGPPVLVEPGVGMQGEPPGVPGGAIGGE